MSRLCHGGQEARFGGPCARATLAALAVQQGVGLASAQGSDVAGTSSTLGRRLGAVPRVGVSISGLGTRVPLPRLAPGGGEAAGDGRDVMILGLRTTAVAGILNGFQPTPGVGGILSLDLVGSYTLARLPAEAGFLTSPSSGFGLGVRVGILRESFTLPGVSVAFARRWQGEVELGDTATEHVVTDFGVSSLRATLGKNWFVLGLMGGVGWDRYQGDARVSVAGRARDPGSVSGHLVSERILYFVGGWFNVLISRISLELGVAEGVTPPADQRGGRYDPAARGWFASTAFRITF